MSLWVAVDFGSTFTKAIAVDAGSGDLVARAEHRTTIDTDVLDGWKACRTALLAADSGVAKADVLACSSAGGGLRIGVVGNEELVTAEAGRRVALSSGGRVVAVVNGGLTATSLKALRAERPDVVLLLGGTDGGNSAVITNAAAVLAKYKWRRPVVAAGNVDAQPEIRELLSAANVPHVIAANVVPEIGVFAPDGARAAIREMFLAHVIGGKNLSRDPGFAAMVRAATPDVVLRGVEVLAKLHGDVAVVDIGGATTDVHSVIELDPEDANLGREVVATHPVTRTVEGDLGMRWSAVPVVAAGIEAGLLDAGTPLDAAAARRHEDPVILAGRCDGGVVRRNPRAGGRDGGVAAACGPAAGDLRAERAGDRAVRARICARSTCSSGPGEYCGTTGRRSPRGSSAASRWERRRKAGWCRPRLAPVWIRTTCLRASACWQTLIRWPRKDWLHRFMERSAPGTSLGGLETSEVS